MKALAAKGCAGFARSLDRMWQHGGRILIGLVDDALEAGRECPDRAAAIRGTRAAHQLARAKLLDDRAALAVLTDRGVAVRIRRAELLDRLGRTEEALRELDGIAGEDATRRLYVVASTARAGKLAEAARAIAEAPIAERPALAFRAAADATSLEAPDGSPELAAAIADRIERERGPAAALAARERAVAGAPDDADYHDALARSQIAAGKIDDALASWDRAAAIAPAQGAFRVTPIRALAIAGEQTRARMRAHALAGLALKSADVELIVTASAGAAAAGDTTLASSLARAARTVKPRDGRIAFLLAQREAEAGRHGTAAELYAELLICGAHGRPWHRHEVSAKLVELGDRTNIVAALDKPRACAPADAADLATYVTAIRGKL